MESTRKKNKLFTVEHAVWFALLVILAVMMVAWSYLPGKNPAGPDEQMRYSVSRWLYHHPGQLPRGDDPKLVNDTWGISYAFYPYLAYMICTCFMWVAHFFGANGKELLYAARHADTVFILVAALFTLKAGKKLFGSKTGLLFSVLVIFTPGFHYLGTYVNNDALALAAVAIIIYGWSIVLEDGWSVKACVVLGIGMGICLMSYYNAYGWVLFSFIFFVTSVLLCTKGTFGQKILFMLKRGIIAAVITLAISAWFFIRNYMIYDGDITGWNASTVSALKYAKEGFKPGQHWKPSMSNWSLKQFLFYQNPGWPHNWLVMSLLTLFGTFGVFHIYMEESVSKAYFFFTWFGMGLMFVLARRQFLLRENSVQILRTKERKDDEILKTVTKKVTISKEFNIRHIMNWMMLGSAAVTVYLYYYYAYYSDIQAQGRYYISALFAMMYFAVGGYQMLLNRLKVKEKIKTALCYAVIVVYIVAAILNYFWIVVPAY